MKRILRVTDKETKEQYDFDFNEVSKQEVKQALSAADIDEKTIEDFLGSVDLFNTSIHNQGLSS